MTICTACPRECGADRRKTRGVCGMTENITIAKAALHFWEEPCISGTKGSGTVFFSGCPLKCVYCQNAKISRDLFGSEVTPQDLMRTFDSLIEKGAHNINLVNPTHFAPALAAVLKAYQSPVPVVYNSGGYEKAETLRLLEGLVDVYLPDIKYFDAAIAKKYSGTENYFEFASKAVLEMHRQTGVLQFDKDGIAVKGLLVRHLILSGNVSQTIKVLQWMRENLPAETAVSLMSQYTPMSQAPGTAPLNRRITKREYEKASDALAAFGFTNGYIQEPDSAGVEYIPDFDLDGIKRGDGLK
jgi:putative pyruvate formate lyase activating enzyme